MIWGPFDIDFAIEVLNDILEVWPKLEEGRRINTLSVSGLLESALEEQFIHGLPDVHVNDIVPKLENRIINGVKSGYALRLGEERTQQYTIEPQVNIGQKQGITPSMRADFQFVCKEERKPVIIFTDGIAFHYDRISADMMQRMGLGKSGRYRSWSLTHWDVNDVPDFSILDWISTLQPNLRAKYIEMGSKIPERRALTRAHADDNFKQF